MTRHRKNNQLLDICLAIFIFMGMIENYRSGEYLSMAIAGFFLFNVVARIILAS